MPKLSVLHPPSPWFVPIGYCDVFDQAHVTVSSCAPNKGIENLRDKKLETFWQSHGQGPHKISITLSRRSKVVGIRIFLALDKDASYTPRFVTIMAGTGLHDQSQLKTAVLANNEGWNNILDQMYQPLDCAQLALTVEENHDYGRDTRIRGLQILTLKDKRCV